jgi:hypothetical protein
MSLRGYKLDDITINLSDFVHVDQIIDEICFTPCSLSVNRSNDKNFMDALSVLCLVECNPHVKKLVIYENEYDDEDRHSIDSRMIAYLSQHCQEVNEVEI